MVQNTTEQTLEQWVVQKLTEEHSISSVDSDLLDEAGKLFFPKLKDSDRALMRRLNKMVDAGLLTKQKYYSGAGRNCNSTGYVGFPTNWTVYTLTKK